METSTTRVDRIHTRKTAPALVGLLSGLALLVGSCSSAAPLLESRNVGPAQRLPVRGTSYYLPKKLVRVRVWRRTVEVPKLDRAGNEMVDENNTPITVKKTIPFAVHERDGSDEIIIPDHRHQFVIAPQWDEASDDYLRVQITPEGLLTEVYGHATDERSEIARGVTDLFSMLLLGPGAASRWTPGTRPDRTRNMNLAGQGSGPEFVAEYEFDPIDPVDRERVRKALKDKYRITMSITKQPDCPTANSGAGCAQTCDCTVPGIYYRLPIPYRFTLSPAGQFYKKGLSGLSLVPSWQFLEGGMERTILFPNEAVCIYAPVSRAAFVTAYTALKFDHGMLAEVITDKPSQLVGFVKIPVDVAGAILAIPAELLTIRINRITKETNVATAQKAAADAEKQRVQSQIDLLDAARKLQGASQPAAPGDDAWK